MKNQKFALLPTAAYRQKDLVKDENGKVIYKTVNGWKRYGKRTAAKAFPHVSVYVVDQKEADFLGVEFTYIRLNFASNETFQGVK